MKNPMDPNLLEAFQGRYELLSELGEGGFGRVYKARQVTTGQNVAVKLLRLTEGATPESVERRSARFEREMKLCAQMHHPNIVRLIDSGRAQGGAVYSIFEFVPGKNLAQVLAEEGVLDPVEVRHLMLQLLDALACAHAQNVVHRDLKPANIMVVPTGARRNALVLDFGIGSVTDELTRAEPQPRITSTNESLGTPSYAAPEQLRGQPPTPRSDLYAWGLVFLECLTGKRVFEGATVAEVIFQQLSAEPVPIPANLAAHPVGKLLQRATAKDPAQRTVSAEVLLRQLEAVDLSNLPRRAAPVRIQPASPNAETATVELSSRTPNALSTRARRWAEGERRQLTVVCCTLSATATAPGPVDIEELDHVLGAQQEVCIEIARRYNGHIASALGDIVLFYFGYPAAREDDARRAAQAALDMVAEVQRRGRAIETERGTRVEIRVGLHTGLVVSREQRDPTLSGLGFVVGTTPKLAFRLSTSAPPGAILLTGDTQQLVRKHFPLEPGPAPVHDLLPPGLETFVLQGADATWSGTEVALSLVGRARELDLLLSRWEQVRVGQGQAVLVTGEPGIGKSRLTRELGDKLGVEPHTWLEARCTADSSSQAYFPVVDLLTRMVDPNRDLSPEGRLKGLEALLSGYSFDLSESMPLFAPLLSLPLPPERWAPLDVSPLKHRELTRDALLAFFAGLAERQPVVLALEDLHWADPSTLELLKELVAEVSSSRLFAVFSARPEFEPPWPSSSVMQVQLGALARAEVERLAAAAVGGPLSAEALEEVASRTDGIPLFIEELVRTLLESGALVQREGRFALEVGKGSPVVPGTLRDLLVARLDRLGRSKETAQVASVLGRELSHELLRHISPLTPEALDADLERLVGAGLLHRKRRPKGPVYLFKHALVRDAAYDSMLKRHRQQVHAKVAAALEEHFPEVVNERPDLLAHHHASANLKRKAIVYAQKAALAALIRSAYVEALLFSRLGLSWLDAIDEPLERAQLELGLNGVLAPALMSTQGWRSQDLRNVAERSLELLFTVGESPYAAPTLWVLSIYYHLGGDQRRVRGLLDRLVALAQASGDAGQEAVALTILSNIELLEGRLGEAKAKADRCVALFDPVAHRMHRILYGQDTRVGGEVVLCRALWLLGFADQAKAHGEAAVAWGRELNHGTSIGLAFIYLLLMAQEHGDRTEATRLISQHAELSHRYGLLEQSAYVGILRGWAAKDLEATRRGVAMREAFGTEMDQPVYYGVLAELELELGHLDAALASVERGRQRAQALGEGYHESRMLRVKGRVLLARDGATALSAEACFRQAAEVAHAQGARMPELQAVTALARLLQTSGRQEEARQRLQIIYSTFTEGFGTPPVAEARALLEALGGDC
ncbi:MAG: TOMM system kinase/cyclase fusion protein [Myxococcaceae bacterium]|nr:MAG: TOMM system kinase/cyclase fusion protein [Myxococcaceae bacterium]